MNIKTDLILDMFWVIFKIMNMMFIYELDVHYNANLLIFQTLQKD